MFIYGTGIYRFAVTKSAPGRAFAVTSAVAGDLATRVMTNMINDSNYLAQISSAQARNITFENGSNNTVANVKIDTKTQEQKEANELGKAEAASASSSNNESSSNLVGSDLDSFAEESLKLIISYLKPFLTPVTVTYSNELLASQIQGISVMLFIITVITIFLFIVFTFNAIILIYRDKIVNYFTNKYIRAYLNLQAKVIAIELIFFSVTILYFLYSIGIGVQFIARHPINFS